MGARSGIIGLIVATLPAAGCALIDGIGGGGDDGGLCESAFEFDCTGSNCSDTTTLGVTPLAMSVVPTCDVVSFAFDLDPVCGSVPDPDNTRSAVFRFEVVDSGDFTICAASDDGFAGAKMIVSDSCDDTPFDGMCVSGTSGCIQRFLPSGSHFLYYQEPNEGTCPPIELDITPLVVGGDEVCITGFDEDQDGSQDCEDQDCRNGSGTCELAVFGDNCDGFDEFTDSSLFDQVNLVDEGGCACGNDQGCDNLPGVVGSPYLCHQDINMPGTTGFCAPRCDIGIDWCSIAFGIPCRGDGRCDLGAVPPMP